MFHDFGWGWIFMGPVFWLIIIGIVVYAIVSNSKRGFNQNFPGPNETPLDIIKKRYAKGELNKEQFEQMKKDLGY